MFKNKFIWTTLVVQRAVLLNKISGRINRFIVQPTEALNSEKALKIHYEGFIEAWALWLQRFDP